MAIPAETKNVTPDGFEVCILCQEKADPPVRFETPVYQRSGYVEGAGQTCTNTQLCQERQNNFFLEPRGPK